MKITKKQAFIKLLTLTDVKKDPELIEFITHEISLLDKRVQSKANKVNRKHNGIKPPVLENIPTNDTAIKRSQSKSDNQKALAVLDRMIYNYRKK